MIFSWEEIAPNRWWGSIVDSNDNSTHVATVSLQSRPVAKGVWEDRWVWDTEPGTPFSHLHCGEKFWKTWAEAIDDCDLELAG